MAIAKKHLLIEFLSDDNVWKYKFSGDWAGKDIKVIASNLRRQYLVYMRTLRRGVQDNVKNP